MGYDNAEISVGVGDPQDHTTVCGECEGAGWQSQAAKRSSGFPTGKHLTNPADRSRVRSGTGSPVRDAIRINIMIMKLELVESPVFKLYVYGNELQLQL